jgi:hypothetical protein
MKTQNTKLQVHDLNVEFFCRLVISVISDILFSEILGPNPSADLTDDFGMSSKFLQVNVETLLQLKVSHPPLRLQYNNILNYR